LRLYNIVIDIMLKQDILKVYKVNYGCI